MMSPLHERLWRSLWLVLLGSLWVGGVSAVVYRQQMQLPFRFFPSIGDDLALLGALVIMALVPCLWVLVVAGLLFWRQRPRWGEACLRLGSGGVWLFLLTDAATLYTSGSHLTHYLTYVRDILTNPEIEGLEMVGGAAGLVRPVAWVLLSVTCGAVASEWGARRLARSVTRPRRAVGIVLSWLLALLGSQLLWTDALVANMTHQRLAVPLPAIRSLSLVRFHRGVRLVEARPSLLERDSVVLRNFGPPQDLTGWSVRTRRASQPLTGRLETGEERDVVLDLDPDSDWVGLFDAREQRREALQYTPASSGFAGTLGYPRDAVRELDGSSAQLQAALRQAVESPVPADPRPRVTSRKHVVILLLESFRRDAITPETAPNLSRWAERGLHLQRHYAGANGTHLGLYSLLYGRAAIFYRRDLAGSVPPQMTETFRSSGYQTSYLCSATFAGWMWMERMLSDQAFHRIDLGHAERTVMGWNNWPIKDREYFEDIPRRLREAQQPQFTVFCVMSTHYPYAFTPEFDRRQPSMGDSQDTRVLSGASQEILKNRYANSVSFVDHLFGRLMEEVDLENTIVVVTGDHGEAIWDDGHISHGSKASEVQLAVPCLIVGGGTPQRQVSELTYHADVLPTLLHLLEGRSVPVEGCHGKDVLEPLTRDVVPAVPVVERPPYQLIFVGSDARLKFDIGSPEWFSGRRDLGVLDPRLTVSFVGDLRPDGNLAGSLPRDFDFAAWQARLSDWSRVLAR